MNHEDAAVACSILEQTTEDDQIGDATKMIDHGPTRSKMGTVEARMQHAAQMERATGKESLPVRKQPKATQKAKGRIEYSNQQTEAKFKR